MKVIIIQPPFVQLNTPYPSGAYLSAYFKKQGHSVQWYDLSLALFNKIFSRAGLAKLFSLSSSKALNLADIAEKKGDSETAFNLRRYISESSEWIQWIDTITAILRSSTSTRELNHSFVFGAFTPRGARMEKYIATLQHDLTTDDAFSLASFALADLADFITTVFDKDFSLIRYAESLTVNETSFEKIAEGTDSPIMKEFFVPLLEDLFCNEQNASFVNPQTLTGQGKLLVCITVPFAGTFTAALTAGRFFKQHFGKQAFISMGGGFVNTELRETNEPLLCEYTDALSYDRGYGSYKALFESELFYSQDDFVLGNNQLYKMKLFLNNANKNTSDSHFTDSNIPDSNLTNSRKPTSIIIQPKDHDAQIEQFENEQTVSLIPDYSDIHFSNYLRMTDDTNPMHRLWNDGAWVKAYLAHGCYWHRCAFCDTTLDYVYAYHPVHVHELYEGLLAQAEAKKVYGIHFVDEAMPPRAMIEFAKENIAHGRKLTFWGNIRFEKSFTRDVADFLAYGGLIGVSAGIEIATSNGLSDINKGTSIESIVASCCAFKEAGVLVHAYMIYGYWNNSDQDTIDSMETLRQFFEAGLLDSSFWHKFVLTRHSTIYNRWKNSQLNDTHATFKPIEPKNSGVFAKNGLHFTGEQSSEKFNEGLNSALDFWMHGEKLQVPVQKFFTFPVPSPKIKKNYIQALIAKYEAQRDTLFTVEESDTIKQEETLIITENTISLAEHNKELISGEPANQHSKRVYWLGGKLYPLNEKTLGWIYMGEHYSTQKNTPVSFYRGKGLCVLPI